VDAALVVHLMSPGAAEGRSGWDAPDGSARHEFVSWRDMPTTVATADLVVAHGLGAFVLAQTVADVGPGLVYRPSRATRPSRHRWYRRLKAAWVAASDSQTGFATAARLGLGQNRVVVVGDEDHEAWNLFVSSMLRGEPMDDDLLPVAPQRLGPLWSGLVRALTRAASRRARSDDRRSSGARLPTTVSTLPAPPAEQPPEPRPVAPFPVDAVPVDAVPVAPLPVVAVPVDADPVDPVRRTRFRRRRFRPRRVSPDAAPAAPVPPDAVPVAPVSVAPVSVAPVSVAPVSVEPVPVEPVPVEPVPAAPLPVAHRLWVGDASRRGRPATLLMGTVEPTTPGQPWWMYRRVDLPNATARAGSNGGGTSRAGSGGRSEASPPAGGPPPPAGPRTPDPEPPDARRGHFEIVQTVAGSGGGPFIAGVALLALVFLFAHFGTIGEGPLVIPIAGLFLTLAAGRRVVRTRPAEAWVGRWLLWGLLMKLVACYARYFTLTVAYGGGGDATDYDKYGRQYANAWRTGTAGPVLKGLKETNFVRFFTGIVYYLFGSSLLTGTFVFGLLALVGSYLWYRATVDAVPMIDKRLYLGLVFFAPSIAFWPALVGKEALMQFGMGMVAMGASLLLRSRLLSALLIGLPGGWLLWVVRPHLLAMVMIAIGAAYLAGRVRSRTGKAGLLSRPLGIVIIAFLVAFSVGQGAKFLGLSSLSFSSIQTELDNTTTHSAEGGSSFNNGGHTLSPVNYPTDVVTVLIRPFPWEAHTGLQLLAAGEGTALAILMVKRRKSLRLAFRRSREAPFLMFAAVLTALYCVAFSSFANFGLLVRERSLVLPAVLVLVAVDPLFGRGRSGSDSRSEEQTVEGREVSASVPARATRV
jgi:hypothetical protein